jgi:hypothetical protein
MTAFELWFQGQPYPVPRKSVLEFLDHRRDLLNAPGYTVQAPIPLDIFQAFVDSLRTQTKLPLTNANAVFLSLLAAEFTFEDLRSECATFSLQSFSILSDRIDQLERQLSVPHSAKIEERFESHERELETLFARLSDLTFPDHDHEPIFARLSEIEARERQLEFQTDAISARLSDLETGARENARHENLRRSVEELQTGLARIEAVLRQMEFPDRLAVQPLISPVSKHRLSNPAPALPPLSRTSPIPKKPLIRLEFAVKTANCLDGIISHLTRKYCGNVIEKGIMAISSRSVYSDYAVKYVADLNSDAYFMSKSDPGQWICWDFRKMSVHLTHYAIRARYLKSWIVDGSVDGTSWVEIDRQRDRDDFNGSGNVAVFAAANGVDCRFVRLTQVDTDCLGRNFLRLEGVEWFGALFEYP